MHRSLLRLAALALLCACTSRVPSRCRRLCAREAECAEELKVEHDRSECVETCTSLDRDPDLQAWVDRHAQCVQRAASCRAVLDCQ